MLTNDANKKIIELWAGVTHADFEAAYQLDREVDYLAKTFIKLTRPGLVMEWDTFPEEYRNILKLLLCIKLSGGKAQDGLNVLTGKLKNERNE